MTLQEDFIILEHDETGNCWRFVAGVAAFSFVELGINGEKGFSIFGYLSTQPKEKERRKCYLGFMTPGASMASIHTPVPGFNPTIHDQVEITYLRTGPIRVYPPR